MPMPRSAAKAGGETEPAEKCLAPLYGAYHVSIAKVAREGQPGSIKGSAFEVLITMEK